MDCKVLDRANKRLAQQHEEIKALQEQLEKARDNLAFQKERTIHFADMVDVRRKDMNVLRARIDEQEEEEIEALRERLTLTQKDCGKYLRELDEARRKINRFRASGRLGNCTAVVADEALIAENVKLKGEVRRLENIVLRKNVELEEKRLEEMNNRDCAAWQESKQTVAQLRQAARRAAEICATCTGRGIYADKLQGVLMEALGEETD